MAKGFKAGAGGGAPLNFKVVGNPQPSNPKENTIWLNTDVPISKWHFDVNQPENMAEGEVWFSVGVSSETPFNALKKNNITVYPISAQQMVSGELKPVIAIVYQNGEWKSWWNGELYNKGEKSPKYTDSLSIGDNITYTDYGTYINLRSKNGGGNITIKNLDLTRFSKLCLNVTGVSIYDGNSDNNATASLSVKNSSGTAASMTVVHGSGNYTDYYRLNTLDISNLKGVYDVVLSVYAYTNDNSSIHVSYHFDKLYLEV